MRTLRPLTALVLALLLIVASGIAFAQSADIIVKGSKPPPPKPPEHPPTEISQNQGQVQGQHQGQAQGQHQAATAINEGVSAIAEGATQSVDIDYPRERKVKFVLGGAASYSATASSPCLKPKEGLGARSLNIFGAVAKSELLIPDEDCWARKDRELDLLERQIALEERKLGIHNDVEECQSTVLTLSEGLERCQDQVFGGKQ